MKLWLLGGMLALSLGCASPASRPVIIPLLNAKPQCFAAGVGKIVECQEHMDLRLVVLYDDWAQIIRALKRACLANGQSPKECQTD